MGDNKRKPDIRFQGFTDDWEQRKLGDMVSFSKGSGYSKGDLKEDGTPIILYGRLYTKYETIISEVDTFVDEKKGSVFSKGGEVIVPASGETAEDISIASVVEKSGVLLGGDLNIITPPDEMDSAFLAISISNGKPHNDMAKMAQGKSVVHLHNTDLEKIDLPYPSHDEQRRISGFFSDLDNLITLQQRKYDKLVNVKKSMLEKMFPREGAKVPEIRFEGFTDDWEQRKLSELITEYKETVDSDCTLPVLTSSKTEGVILQEEHFGRKQNHDITGYNILPRNYCTYRNRSDGIDFTFNINKCCDRGIISKFYPVFCGNNNDTFFISLVLNNSDDVVREIGYTCTGTGQKVLSFLDLQKMSLRVPSYEEQKNISTYFDMFDNLITLQQRKLEKLNNIKKSMLEKMFV